MNAEVVAVEDRHARLAVQEARRAVEWIENGGPVEYDLGEALHHLEQAVRDVKRALSRVG